MKSIRVPSYGGEFVIVHAPDQVVDLKVGKRTYTLEYCKSLGPAFYFKNGKPYFPSHRAPVWAAFAEFLKTRREWA